MNNEIVENNDNNQFEQNEQNQGALIEECLSNVPINKKVKICNVLGSLKLKRRLMDLGFTNNAIVKTLTISPLKNSYLLSLHGYTIALRRNAVECIFVKVEQ